MKKSLKIEQELMQQRLARQRQKVKAKRVKANKVKQKSRARKYWRLKHAESYRFYKQQQREIKKFELAKQHPVETEQYEVYDWLGLGEGVNEDG